MEAEENKAKEEEMQEKMIKEVEDKAYNEGYTDAEQLYKEDDLIGGLNEMGSIDDIDGLGDMEGIPEDILVDHEDTCIRIPMIGDIRSLNLSNSVAIVAYEALRQHGFENMSLSGELHKLHWK